MEDARAGFSPVSRPQPRLRRLGAWDSVHFADRIVLPYEPRLIVIYAGGNDINAGKTPEQVFADFKAFVAKVRAKLPETRIAYISIAGNPDALGAGRARESRQRAHRSLRESEPHMTSSTSSRHARRRRPAAPDIFVDDRLHMNAEGYAIWTRVVVGPGAKP